jgi:hypothetical protein
MPKGKGLFVAFPSFIAISGKMRTDTERWRTDMRESIWRRNPYVNSRPRNAQISSRIKQVQNLGSGILKD